MSNDRTGMGRGSASQPPQRRLWSDRFVGRERQLERIAVGLQDAADGKPSTLVLSGTAGLGLSRLLLETRRRVGSLAEPFVAVHGIALPAMSGVPYAPVTAALEQLLTPLPDEALGTLVGPTGDAIAAIVPSLRERLEELQLLPDRPRIAAPEWREARTFEAVLGLLERLGEQRPVVLLLEDLHHADAATRGLLSFLARASRGQRVAVLASYQPDRLLRSNPLRAALSGMVLSPSVSVWDVPPLERAELSQLIEAIDGARPSSTTLLLVWERSHGNPLIAEELLAARREQLGVSLSGSLERLVTSRAALRSPECRRVLRLLSLAGAPVSMSMLMAIASEFERRAPNRPPRSAPGLRRGEGLEGDIEAGVEEALEYGFLVGTMEEGSRPRDSADGAAEARKRRGGGSRQIETSNRGRAPADGEGTGGRSGRRPAPSREALVADEPERLIGFRHELLAEAIAADLLPASRRRYHAALAAAIDMGPEPAMALEHYLAAQDLAAASNTAIAAAAAAEELDEGADALAHYEVALGLYEIAPPDGTAPRLADLYLKSAEAAFASGDPSRACAYTEAAAAALDDPRERPALGLAMEALGRYRRSAGDHDGALAALRRAVDLVPVEPSAARARVLAGLAQFRMLEGVFSEAKRYAQEAVEIATEVGEAAQQELLHATCTMAVADAWGDDPEPAVGLLRRTRDQVAELGRLDDLFRVYANLTTVLDLLGRRTGRPGNRLRELPEGERGRLAVLPRPLGRMSAPLPGRPQLESRGHLVPLAAAATDDPRGRERCRGVGRAPARPGSVGHRDGPGSPVLGAGPAGCRSLCPMAGGPPGCPPSRRAGLGARQRHGGLAADGPDGRNMPRGGRGHRPGCTPPA